jgi:uncharacterized RDD family membrane protein YckC
MLQTCPSCGLPNAVSQRRCERCSQPLGRAAAQAVSVDEPTTLDIRVPTASITQEVTLPTGVDPGTSAVPAAWQKRPAPPAVRPPAAVQRPPPLQRASARLTAPGPTAGRTHLPELDAATYRAPALWRLGLAAGVDLGLAATAGGACLWAESRLRGLGWPKGAAGLLERAALWIHAHPGAAGRGTAVLLLTGLLQAYLGSFHGQTLGRFVTGIRLVGQHHPLPSRPQALGRALSTLLSALPFFAGFYWAVLDSQHRCWHDRLWNTRSVVNG